MCPSPINSDDEIRKHLAVACDTREVLFLVTPNVRFESHFLRLDPHEFQAWASMDMEEATYTLRTEDLRLRFPAQGRFLEGPTRLLGFGRAEGRRSLRLALPPMLQDDEQRAAYRVEQVGRVEVTFSTDRYQLDGGRLSNLSATGALIRTHQDPSHLDIEVGTRLLVSIPLTDAIRISGPALVRWRNQRALGLQFEPPLKDQVLTDLSRWIFRKREEALERAILAPRGPAPAPPQGPRGVLLISTSPALEASLQEAWEELPPLQRVPPVAQALKDALAQAPLLLLLHLPDGSLDTRRRAKLLAEGIAGQAPLLLLGSGFTQESLFDLGTDLKAVGVYGLTGPPPPILFRLIKGILVRHGNGVP